MPSKKRRLAQANHQEMLLLLLGENTSGFLEQYFTLKDQRVHQSKSSKSWTKDKLISELEILQSEDFYTVKAMAEALDMHQCTLKSKAKKYGI